MSSSTLCKVDYPLYCCHCFDNEAFVVAGGGGAAKTGVHNTVEILELSRKKKKCSASSINQLNTAEHAVMSMSVASLNQGNCTLALSMNKQCNVYEVEKVSEAVKNETTKEGLKQRKKKTVEKPAESHQGIANYKFQLIHEIDAVKKEGGFQSCVKLNSDATLVVSGGSDGHVRVWKLPENKKVFDSNGHKDEVTDVDISSDSKMILSVSRDGRASLWDLATGYKLLELHSMWNMHMVTRKYRFRNCRFGVVPNHSDQTWIFSSHTPVSSDPKSKSYCCITKWAKKRDKEGKELSDYMPAIIQGAGKESISAMTISRNGVFLGVGFMEGSVAIYISFSLQCARRFNNVHSIFVTSLSFVNDNPQTKALTGDCDAALISVSADRTCYMAKLDSRTLFSLWFVVIVCSLTLVGVAIYLHHMGVI